LKQIILFSFISYTDFLQHSATEEEGRRLKTCLHTEK